MKYAGLVLAAGRGSRFQHETGEPFPKVLRPVLGKPMVVGVIDTLEQAGIDEVTLIVGFGAEEVMRVVGARAQYVLQEEQKGSGHAVACARDAFKEFEGGLVIMCGDSPLFAVETIKKLMQTHQSTAATITLASATLEDPHGYGRILRDGDGHITGIVEEKCATPEQRSIRGVNGGAYVFDSEWLFDNISLMELNEANEYNLTDMVRVAIEQNRTVSAVECDPSELLGVNTPAQLAVVEEILRSRD